MPAYQGAGQHIVSMTERRLGVGNAVMMVSQTAALSIASTTERGRYAWTVEGARYANIRSYGRNADCATERRSAPMGDGNPLAVNVLQLHFVCTTETSITVLIVELSKLSKLQNSHRHCVPTAGLNIHAPSVTANRCAYIKSKRQGAACVEMPAYQDAARRSVCTIDGRRDAENAVMQVS